LRFLPVWVNYKEPFSSELLSRQIAFPTELDSVRAGIWRFLVLPLLAIAWPLPAAAQEQPAEPSPPREAPPAQTESPEPVVGPAVEARDLNTFLLRDNKGNLVPVLGITFEEFEALWKLKRGLTPPAPPGFTLDALSISGTASGNVADLQITLTIRIREPGWIRVPLGLQGAVIRQPSKYEGSGEHFLTYEEPGGYTAWLKDADAKPHILTLQASAGLTTTGEETRLSLSLPRSTESTLRVTAAGDSLEANLAGGEGIAATAAKGKDKSEVTVLGAAGDLVLTWRPARQVAQAGPAVFDASGEIAVKIESETRISSDAKLRVRSLSKPLDVFQIRLPPGMELVPTSPTGYVVNIVSPPATTEGRNAQSQVVEVRLDRPATATTEIRLLATSLPGASGSPTHSPGRFEVLGAVRQRGTIDVAVEGEWQIDWQEDGTVRRLDISADASAARLAARFEYFRQPCGMTLKVAPRPSRVTVEPTYLVFVEPRQVRVETTLKYRLRGSRATGLHFQLGDVQFDRLSPDDLFDSPEQPGTDGQVQIPFRQGVAVPADLELKLQTHLPLPENAARLSLRLPRPLADSVAPATVFVVAADNVEVTPQTSELEGLSPDTATPPVGLAERQQPPLVYRDLGGGEAATFVAALATRTRATRAEAQAKVRIDRRQMQIEQRLEYRVSHEPQRTFVLVVPRGFSIVGGMQVWLGDELLNLSTPAALSAGGSPAERLQFTTPGDQIGSFAVVVRYTQALPRWDGVKPLPLTIPLVLPADDTNHQFAGQRIEFDLADDLQIEAESSGVDEFSRATALPGAPPGTAFTWSKGLSNTRWTLQPAQGTEASVVTCHKAWVQTWLTPAAREERAVFRLTTAAESVQVRLPEGAVAARVQAAVNAEPALVAPREAGRYRITLPTAARGRECVLELWYSVRPLPGRLGVHAGSLQPARLDEATPPRRFYWQLALPENEHLLLTPADFSPEMQWNDDWWLAGRQPLLGQGQLEDWSASSRQDPLPRGTNDYLFGALGRAPQLNVVIVNRRLLLALSSCAALALGLAAIRWQPLRSPLSLFVAGAVIAGLALAAPDAALLVGRAAILGLVVLLVIGVLQWSTSVRPAQPAPGRSAFRRPAEAGPSTAHPPRAERPAPLTTATAPAPFAVGEPRA
jgi:hypothetical protein